MIRISTKAGGKHERAWANERAMDNQNFACSDVSKLWQSANLALRFIFRILIHAPQDRQIWTTLTANNVEVNIYLNMCVAIVLRKTVPLLIRSTPQETRTHDISPLPNPIEIARHRHTHGSYKEPQRTSCRPTEPVCHIKLDRAIGGRGLV